jgi:hypothetical protein
MKRACFTSANLSQKPGRAASDLFKTSYSRMKIYLNFFCLFIIIANTLAQDDSSDVDFNFREGVYIVFAQLRNNQPIEKSRIISQTDFNDPQFFEQVLTNPELSYYDNNGMKQSIEVKKIWGYSKNGDIYVGINEQFCKVSYLGKICHFIVPNFRTEYETVYDPYYYNNPYYYSRGARYANPKTELKQFIIDFETGRVIDYTADNVIALLAKDPELYDEYAALKKKKREQLKFFYIRKFNQRNPLKIPN